jgi:DNA-binding NarL/FixJ family response regulator
MKGETTKAEVLALEGATRLGENHTLFSHAHYLAGLSAHLGNREEAAFRHHEIAVSSAQDSVDELKARWGRFVVASTLERDETRVLLDELLASAVDAPDEAFLRCFSNLMYEFRLGSIATTRGLIVEGFSLVDRIRDPIMVSSFLQISTAATVLSGNYAHASELVTRQFAHIGAFRLDFAEPHAHLNRAGVQMGLRQFNSAVTSLATAERLAHASDPLMDINVALARARLAVTVGDRSGALTHLGTAPDSGCNVGIQSEYLATLGLVNACSGNYRTALNLAQEASSLSSQSETRVLAPCIRAIVAIGDCGADAPADASSALAAALEIGNLDSFICACRAFPGLLRSLASHPESQPALQAMFSRSSDVKLASSAGLRTATPLDGWAGLSAREQEVYGLLAQGLTNREIAQTLYISEVTVKVHVRHILGKLGVRSRTEAAIRAITQEKG